MANNTVDFSGTGVLAELGIFSRFGPDTLNTQVELDEDLRVRPIQR